MRRMRTLFVINPAAGHRAAERWRVIASQLKAQGLAFEEAVTTAPGDACRIARARAADYELVVTVGGDGTVFEVLNGIIESGSSHTALGMVPFGTGNDVASAVGIYNEAEALQAAEKGQSRPVDLIRINCRVNGAAVVRHAMLFASVGITSELVTRTTPRLKRLCGQRLAYIVGLLFALRRYSTPIMKITCDGQTVEKQFIFACASNGETFGGGMRIAPGALLDDGKLNTNLIESIRPWEALRHLPKLLTGAHVTHPKVSYKLASDLVIETEPPIEVAADGDLIGYTPARFQVRPRALTVLVP